MTTEELVNYLKNKLPGMPTRKGYHAVYLTQVIITGLMDKEIDFGTKLPKQSALFWELTPVSMPTIQKLWHILIKELKLAGSNTIGGTTIISELSDDRRKQLLAWMKDHPLVDEAQRFDMFFPSILSKPAMAQINEATYHALGDDENGGCKPCRENVIKAVRCIMNERTRQVYEYNELFESNHYDLLFTHICQWSIPEEQVLVSTAYCFKRLKAIFEETVLHYRTITPDDYHNLGRLLRSINSERKIGLVHVQLSSLYPNASSWNPDNLKQLFVLQREMGFRLLIDDFVLDLAVTARLYRMVPFDLKFRIIFITKCSIAVPFRPICIVAGPKLLIGHLKKKTEHRSRFASSTTGIALRNLCASGQLRAAETETYENMKDIIQEAKMELLKGDIFIHEYIKEHQGFFFYLMPRRGKLTKEFFKRLKIERVYVFDPSKFDVPGFFEGGVLISVISYRDSALLIKHLKNLKNLIQQHLDSIEEKAYREKLAVITKSKSYEQTLRQKNGEDVNVSAPEKIIKAETRASGKASSKASFNE